MNQSNRSSSQVSNSGRVSHTNFIEALKSTGSSIAQDTVKGFTNDVLKGTAKQISQTVFNSSSPDQQTQEQAEPPFNFSEYLQSNEKKVKAQQYVKYEYEQTETVVFNRRQEEVNKKIDQIRIELQQLSKEIVFLDTSTQAVIEQELVDPGTYHLNFFEKLLSFIRHMKKRVVESRHWASLQSQRSQAKSHYWKMANKKVGGTQFSQSQERTVATQTG